MFYTQGIEGVFCLIVCLWAYNRAQNGSFVPVNRKPYKKERFCMAEYISPLLFNFISIFVQAHERKRM